MKPLLVMAFSVLLATAAAVQEKSRVAVFSLEFATVKSAADAAFGASVDIGKGTSELIVHALVRGGQVDVYEREQFEKIVAEQDVTNTSRFDAATAAKIGRIVGVQAVLIGSITKFAQEERGLLGVKRTETVIEVIGRVVDTSTGKILYTVKGAAEDRRNGFNIRDMPWANRIGKGQTLAIPASEWKGEKFKASPIGTVMAKAAEDAANDLVAQRDKITAATISGPAREPQLPSPSATSPLTVQVLVEMIKAQVPEPQIIEIIKAHKNFAISPLDPSWAIAVATNKISVALQNAVRERANLPPLPVHGELTVMPANTSERTRHRACYSPAHIGMVVRPQPGTTTRLAFNRSTPREIRTRPKPASHHGHAAIGV
jgi:curli biogenesis system outer membrane secretion channel CsgG